MLHIILLILKILGLLILGILGLIVLLTAVVLLAPAGYSLEASGKDTPESLRGRLKFHWLFRLISGEMEYKDGGLAWRMRAGWKKFGSGMEEEWKRTLLPGKRTRIITILSRNFPKKRKSSREVRRKRVGCKRSRRSLSRQKTRRKKPGRNWNRIRRNRREKYRAIRWKAGGKKPGKESKNSLCMKD